VTTRPQHVVFGAGEGLAVLGEHPDAVGEVWHLPNDPDTRTTRQLVDIAYRHAGRSRRFVVDSSKIATSLGAKATPVDDAVADTLDAYRHDAANPPLIARAGAGRHHIGPSVKRTR